jgi:hypothetical protein
MKQRGRYLQAREPNFLGGNFGGKFKDSNNLNNIIRYLRILFGRRLATILAQRNSRTCLPHGIRGVDGSKIDVGENECRSSM